MDTILQGAESLLHGVEQLSLPLNPGQVQYLAYLVPMSSAGRRFVSRKESQRLPEHRLCRLLPEASVLKRSTYIENDVIRKQKLVGYL